ncbi:Selenoprotein W [Mizuhopecten yessoensis]|uniref:Selenoprotein W n=1 Tax=Mizuhopecten yessoensis TaxID=6573 RepID=A0A210PM85_MIZYE|nr:Selenoprotein W [Mizuhopecten yessoensis]
MFLSVYEASLNTLVPFQKLKNQLQKKFGNGVTMDHYATPNVTGFFEVSVNDKLIHSKKNSDGYVDTDAKLDKIVKAVEAAS